MLPSSFVARGKVYADDVAPPELDDFPEPWRLRGQKMVVHFRAQDIALDFLHDRPEAFAAQSAATAVFQPMTEKASCGPEVFGIWLWY